MKNIQELVGLVQEVSAVVNDLGIENVTIDYKGRVKVLVSPKAFFETFTGFKIKVLKGSFKFRLEKEIQGVVFTTLVNQLDGLHVVRRNVVKRHEKSLRAVQCG